MSTQSSSAVQKPRTNLDPLFRFITRCFAFLVLALLAAILASLVEGSMPAINRFGFGFLTDATWDPVAEQFGALVPIFGTLVTASIALAIGVPVSFGIAMFLTELCPLGLRRPLGVAIELLAGIPSIIYGMWGLFVFAPLFADYFQMPVQKLLGSMPLVGFLFGGSTNGFGILAAAILRGPGNTRR